MVLKPYSNPNPNTDPNSNARPVIDPNEIPLTPQEDRGDEGPAGGGVPPPGDPGGGGPGGPGGGGDGVPRYRRGEWPEACVRFVSSLSVVELARFPGTALDAPNIPRAIKQGNLPGGPHAAFLGKSLFRFG